VQKWYGISASTAERELTQLHDLGLLYREQWRRAEPESPVGFADTYYSMLRPPFGPRGCVSSSRQREQGEGDEQAGDPRERHDFAAS
jgi:hypothetical protein